MHNDAIVVDGCFVMEHATGMNGTLTTVLAVGMDSIYGAGGKGQGQPKRSGGKNTASNNRTLSSVAWTNQLRLQNQDPIVEAAVATATGRAVAV